MLLQTLYAGPRSVCTSSASVSLKRTRGPCRLCICTLNYIVTNCTQLDNRKRLQSDLNLEGREKKIPKHTHVRVAERFKLRKSLQCHCKPNTIYDLCALSLTYFHSAYNYRAENKMMRNISWGYNKSDPIP